MGDRKHDGSDPLFIQLKDIPLKWTRINFLKDRSNLGDMVAHYAHNSEF